MEIREMAGDEDLIKSYHLGRQAFGGRPGPVPDWVLQPRPGVIRYGAFDSDGALIGRVVDRQHHQWWGGRKVASADVAGVAVIPEARGGGLARTLLTRLLRGARDRGAAVSALYPTVSPVYRSLGWEIAGSLTTVDIPASSLAFFRAGSGLVVRPARLADVPAVRALYARVAQSRCGLLVREGALFEPPAPELFPSEVDGITLVEEAGTLVGYASYIRGESYDHTSVLTVEDLLAVTPGAADALLSVLGGWRTVAPTLRLRLLDSDAVSVRLPLELARENSAQPWMHRVVDVERAVSSRGWPSHVSGSVAFTLDDPVCEWNSGNWVFEVSGGEGVLTRSGSEASVRLTVRGFGLLYAGKARGRQLVEAGLAGGDGVGGLDLLASGPPAELLDYF